MYVNYLQCVSCGETNDIKPLYLCPSCGGILEAKYDYKKLRKLALQILQSSPSYNIWKYSFLLPVKNEANRISLYEGGTPLIKSFNLSKKIKLQNLYLKDETRNPSGAFKDRPIAVGISMAKEFGYDTVTTASSGNAAASLASYCAKADIRCYIFVPEKTPSEKVTQALTNGGILIKVKGSYSNAYKTALNSAKKFGWMNITTTFLNPYTVEGDKTVSYEISQQLGGYVPDWILIPTGAGPLLFGIYKGFLELKIMGLIKSTPRMVAVQAEGCAPIVRSFEKGLEKVMAWKNPTTLASAIADPLKGYEQDGELVLRIVRQSRGSAVSVSDEEIMEAIFLLAQHEGVYAEPAAAAPIAGLKKLLNAGVINNSETVVCVVTGHGLKDPKSVSLEMDVPVIEPEVEEVEKLLTKKKSR